MLIIKKHLEWGETDPAQIVFILIILDGLTQLDMSYLNIWEYH